MAFACLQFTIKLERLLQLLDRIVIHHFGLV